MGGVLIALAVALTVGLTLNAVGERADRLALDLSLAQTRKYAKLVSSRLVELQLAMRSASEAGDARELNEADQARRFLTQHVELVRQFDSLFVATPGGKMLAQQDDRGLHYPDFSIADRQYFQLTIAQQRPIISEPVMGRAAKQPMLILTFPVRGSDGKVAAVLGGGLRMATHRLLADIVDIDDDDPSRTVVVDARGRIVAHHDRDWLMREAALEPALTSAIERWTEAGRPAEPSGEALRLGHRLITSAGVPDAEWVVFRSVDEDAVLGGVTQARQQAVKVGALVAAVGGLLLLATTMVLLRPLRKLERVAQSLADGALPDAAAWPVARGEIGRLAAVLRRSIEDRAAADADGRRLLAQLQAMMAHAPVGFAFTRERRFEMVSAHFERLLGYPAGLLAGQPPRIIYASDQVYDEIGARVSAAFGERRAFEEEIECVRRDGSHFWGGLKGQPVRWDEAGAGTIWTLQDVTEQRRERQSLAWASAHDALTALVNRAEYGRRLERLLKDRRVVHASALFIDLDRFKAINDSSGHAAGDAMLVAVARAPESEVRHGDTVARLGGDEFAVLLPGCPREGALRLAEKMRAAIEALDLTWAGQQHAVSASIGVVHLEAGLSDIAAVMAAADAACYAAKRSGRNGVREHVQPGLRLVSS
jgi:diguanylate cyclase (GGDEF)-like protein/PAS domain S-box-containing protein